MSLENFADLYRRHGFEVTINGDELKMSHEGVDFHVTVDEYWQKEIISFFKAKQYEFDDECRVLVSNRCVEFQIVRLAGAFFSRPDIEFSDERGNFVKLNAATSQFVLSLLCSDSAQRVLEMVAKRIHRVAERRNTNKSIWRRIDDILAIPQTARYEIPRKIKRENLIYIGRNRVKATLFKLSYVGNECWELKESIKSNGQKYTYTDGDIDDSIPRRLNKTGRVD